jgi:hypothetical protein
LLKPLASIAPQGTDSMRNNTPSRLREAFFAPRTDVKITTTINARFMG